MARDRLLSPTALEVGLRLAGTLNSHGDTYSLPNVPELVGLLIGDLLTNVCEFNVVVKAHSHDLKHILPTHPALMSL